MKHDTTVVLNHRKIDLSGIPFLGANTVSSQMSLGRPQVRDVPSLYICVHFH